MRRQFLIGCLGLAVTAISGHAEARTHHRRRKTTTTVTQAPAAPAAETAPDAPKTTTYDPAAGFPDRNGPLSGMLVVIPKSEMSAFGQPGTRHLNRVARAEPGAELALKLVFTGPQADDKGIATVTYDLQVYRPDGKLYGASDYRGLEALHGAVPAGGVFDNRSKVVLLSFDPEDPPGTYTIKSTLHDTVGARDLPLMTSIELISKAPPAASAAPETSSGSSAMSPIADSEPPKKKHRRRRRH
ncbi:MAG: hypothetical protein JF571_03440 [Asticcacaulis sp.]|nr:hypothetical protein [Asticcacaulis sp.]